MQLSYIHWGYAGLVICLLVAVLLRRRSARTLLSSVTVALFLWSWPPIAYLTSKSLEFRYPPITVVPAAAQAIVVLAAGEGRSDSPDGPLPATATYLRCHYAAWLAKQSPSLPVFAAGGPAYSSTPLSVIMQSALEKEGVPATSVAVEAASTSTYTNAVNIARMLQPRGLHTIALVTDAIHMPRAAACFRKQGLSVLPAPCNFRTRGVSHGVSWFLPSEESVADNEEVLHEWAGLVWYALARRL